MSPGSESPRRTRSLIRGTVQGVGFRPFVFRRASTLGLTGWVGNSSSGLVVELEGSSTAIETFFDTLESEKPKRAILRSVAREELRPAGYRTFEIRPSLSEGMATTEVLPDLAPCADCLADLRDPANRRYRYPFTHCTACGPRYSILERLPYSRENTTMRVFPLCAECREEYDSPESRRFHAEPIACPRCGPRLSFLDTADRIVSREEDALQEALRRIREGKCVAVKAIGGFHLMVDSRNHAAVARLREQKHRPHKPFALLYPSLEAIREDCLVSDEEAKALTGAEAPIVILESRISGGAWIGAMLPSSPMQYLIAETLGFPVVATSGNVSGEPLCIDNQVALSRLAGIAEGFLVHDRPIARAVDDGVTRRISDRIVTLRLGRGSSPLSLPAPSPGEIIGLGGHLKTSIAIGRNGRILTSQYLGDLETAECRDHYRRESRAFLGLWGIHRSMGAHDAHPDYFTTSIAERYLGATAVFHHEAHVWSCLVDNDASPPCLGVAWDGTGLGADGALWGGEFLLLTKGDCRRVAHLRPFPLPGGERAARAPRRSAFALMTLLGMPLDRLNFSEPERRLLSGMLSKAVNCPYTTSVGRLFDAVAALLGLVEEVTYEGQAAIALEQCAGGDGDFDPYPFFLADSSPIVADWAPMIRAILEESSTRIAAKRFHRTLAEIIVAVAKKTGEPRVALTGGCFQNRLLSETTSRRLSEEGFEVLLHRSVPPNDGGLAVGQVAAALNKGARPCA